MSTEQDIYYNIWFYFRLFQNTIPFVTLAQSIFLIDWGNLLGNPANPGVAGSESPLKNG